MGLRASLLALCVLTAACEIRIAERQGADDDITNPQCGNGLVEGSEVCDDGNTADGDGCNASCNSDESCGNGVIDDLMAETCDDGNLLGGDGCAADCKSDETCGNGVIDEAKGETCDDGDLQGGDGCSANCQSNESCGNNVTDSATTPPEQCDDGPSGSATCDVNCTTATCGDMTVNALAGEQCDAGASGNAQCDANCTTAFCGDQTVNTFRNEQCDDGNSTTTDACIACKSAFCGDGFVRAGVEQCDDQNATLTDACTVNCQAAFCGDGFVRAGVEQCDGGSGCGSDCKFLPRTYVVERAGLIGMTTSCDTVGGIHLYDSCTMTPTGFTWVDSSPFTPSSITIEYINGINCVGAASFSTDLNGGGTGTLTVNAPGNCACDPLAQPNSYSFGNPGTYNVNGTNTFMLSGATSCFGYSPMASGYARITVFP
jgi:cysteine-rich repeat protein